MFILYVQVSLLFGLHAKHLMFCLLGKKYQSFKQNKSCSILSLITEQKDTICVWDFDATM